VVFAEGRDGLGMSMPHGVQLLTREGAEMKRRRTLVAGVAATLLGATHRANAQAGKRRVAILFIGPQVSRDDRDQWPLMVGLRELGWIEGGNLIVDWRWDQGDATRWASLTSELLALEPDVFVAAVDFMLGPAVGADRKLSHL
jgi:hypothetical protein